jgi:hypothetical protein
MQLSQEVRKLAARVGDQVVMIRHEAGCVQNHARLLERDA